MFDNDQARPNNEVAHNPTWLTLREFLQAAEVAPKSNLAVPPPLVRNDPPEPAQPEPNVVFHPIGRPLPVLLSEEPSVSSAGIGLDALEG